jgi:hypothetical protein
MSTADTGPPPAPPPRRAASVVAGSGVSAFGRGGTAQRTVGGSAWRSARVGGPGLLAFLFEGSPAAQAEPASEAASGVELMASSSNTSRAPMVSMKVF